MSEPVTNNWGASEEDVVRHLEADSNRADLLRVAIWAGAVAAVGSLTALTGSIADIFGDPELLQVVLGVLGAGSASALAFLGATVVERRGNVRFRRSILEVQAHGIAYLERLSRPARTPGPAHVQGEEATEEE